MKGIVQGVNRQTMRVVVLTDSGYTVFDFNECNFDIGDVVYGDLDSHGDVSLKKESTGEVCSVYVEAIQATKESAQSLLSHR